MNYSKTGTNQYENLSIHFLCRLFYTGSRGTCIPGHEAGDALDGVPNHYWAQSLTFTHNRQFCKMPVSLVSLWIGVKKTEVVRGNPRTMGQTCELHRHTQTHTHGGGGDRTPNPKGVKQSHRQTC